MAEGSKEHGETRGEEVGSGSEATWARKNDPRDPDWITGEEYRSTGEDEEDSDTMPDMLNIRERLLRKRKGATNRAGEILSASYKKAARSATKRQARSSSARTLQSSSRGRGKEARPTALPRLPDRFLSGTADQGSPSNREVSIIGTAEDRERKSMELHDQEETTMAKPSNRSLTEQPRMSLNEGELAILVMARRSGHLYCTNCKNEESLMKRGIWTIEARLEVQAVGQTDFRTAHTHNA